jgi:hypothetical protein
MDDIGNWLYIIIIAVVAISSMFGSLKKKKQQQTAQENKPKTLEDIFSEFDRQTDAGETVYDDIPRREIYEPAAPPPPANKNPGQAIPVKEVPPQRVPTFGTTTPKEEQYSFYDSHKSKYQKKHQEATPSFQSYSQSPIEPEEEIPVFSSDDFPEDIAEWRKAFIYNEIFNNKFQKVNE